MNLFLIQEINSIGSFRDTYNDLLLVRASSKEESLNKASVALGNSEIKKTGFYRSVVISQEWVDRELNIINSRRDFLSRII